MSHYYLNDNHTYRPCELMEWAKQFDEMERHVAENDIEENRVSTVWLGLDYSHWRGKPMLFETMIFDKGGNDIYCARYTTWQEAEEGHKKAIEWVKNGCKDIE